MAQFSAGDHVWADFGEGKRLAHLETAAKDDDGKYQVQNPENGRAEPLGYREPEDRDEHGSGRTFWTL